MSTELLTALVVMVAKDIGIHLLELLAQMV
jgi:hypothetical protein